VPKSVSSTDKKALYLSGTLGKQFGRSWLVAAEASGSGKTL